MKRSRVSVADDDLSVRKCIDMLCSVLEMNKTEVARYCFYKELLKHKNISKKIKLNYEFDIKFIEFKTRKKKYSQAKQMMNFKTYQSYEVFNLKKDIARQLMGNVPNKMILINIKSHVKRITINCDKKILKGLNPELKEIKRYDIKIIEDWKKDIKTLKVSMVKSDRIFMMCTDGRDRFIEYKNIMINAE